MHPGTLPRRSGRTFALKSNRGTVYAVPLFLAIRAHVRYNSRKDMLSVPMGERREVLRRRAYEEKEGKRNTPSVHDYNVVRTQDLDTLWLCGELYSGYAFLCDSSPRYYQVMMNSAWGGN